MILFHHRAGRSSTLPKLAAGAGIALAFAPSKGMVAVCKHSYD